MTIKLVFAAKHTVRAKTGCHGIEIMCQNEATCLPAYCYFSELAL